MQAYENPHYQACSMKASTHFDIKELVHPLFIEDHGEEKMVRVMKEYAPWLLVGLENLKDFISGDSIIINDYKWGGHYKSSGLRHHDDPVGAEMSGHYYFRSMDCKVKRNVKELQLDILDNQRLHPYILRMEDARHTPTWLHIDFGYRLPNHKIRVFSP